METTGYPRCQKEEEEEKKSTLNHNDEGIPLVFTQHDNPLGHMPDPTDTWPRLNQRRVIEYEFGGTNSSLVPTTQHPGEFGLM